LEGYWIMGVRAWWRATEGRQREKESTENKKRNSAATGVEKRGGAGVPPTREGGKSKEKRSNGNPGPNTTSVLDSMKVKINSGNAKELTESYTKK